MVEVGGLVGAAFTLSIASSCRILDQVMGVGMLGLFSYLLFLGLLVALFRFAAIGGNRDRLSAVASMLAARFR